MQYVVNVRHTDDYDIYVGRHNPRKKLTGHPLANPFRIGPDGTRAQVLERYRAYLESRPDLLGVVARLAGRRIACWCRPKDGFQGRLLCHAQVVAGLANGIRPEDIP